MNLHCLSYLTHHLLLQLSICLLFHLQLSNICSSWFSLLLLVAWFLFIAFFIWAISFYMTLFTTTKVSIIVRIEITSFLVAIPFLLASLLRFLFKNPLNFLDNKLRFSSSLSSLESCLLLCLAAFKAMLLTCLSSLSWTLSLFISNSCSLSLPNNEAVVKDVKSFDYEIVVSLGCQNISRHLIILMFSYSLSKVFPRLIRWLMMWMNLFCTSAIDSPLSTLNISYSCIRVCFLALFTSFIPSWVTSKVSHISLADEHCDSLKNSSEFKEEVMIFLAIQSNLAFLFSASVH